MTPEMKKKILIVDDEIESLAYLGQILLREDYYVIYANNGADAISLAIQHLPDLIILDMMMPGIEGSEVATTLREDPTTKDIPLLIVSGAILSKNDQIPNNAPEHNQYVLAKPITPSEIIELVQKILLTRH